MAGFLLMTIGKARRIISRERQTLDGMSLYETICLICKTVMEKSKVLRRRVGNQDLLV
jgi:hypothetical protein